MMVTFVRDGIKVAGGVHAWKTAQETNVDDEAYY
jgi:hypothetical protein